jgi:transposase InsO family protein
VLADGRRFQVLVIVDDFTRECLALGVDTSISGRRVARELDVIVAARSKPTKDVMRKEGAGKPRRRRHSSAQPQRIVRWAVVWIARLASVVSAAGGVRLRSRPAM